MGGGGVCGQRFEPCDVFAIEVAMLVVEVVVGEREIEGAAIGVGGARGVAAGSMESSTELDPFDLVGMVALEAVADVGGLVEAACVHQVDGEASRAR